MSLFISDIDIDGLEEYFKKTVLPSDLLIYNNLCVSSLSSLNFRDGTVINRFLTDLNQQIEYDYENGDDTIRNICTTKCLEDKQGNRLSIRDWYKMDKEEGTEA